MNNLIAFHPVADVFPLMQDSDFAALCEDIRANGLRNSIWTFRGAIIDGRNRYNACLKTGVEPRFEEWDGMGSLSATVVSLNLHRRHLSEEQRTMVAARICNLRRGERKSNAPIGAFDEEPLISQQDAADLMHVSRRNVQRGVRIIEDGVADLAERVEAGELSVNAAAEIASLPRTKQKRLLAKGDKGKIVSLAQSIKVEAKLKKARSTHDLCLVCNERPKAEITEDDFKAYLVVLAQKVGGNPRRYVQSIIDEMDELGVADDMLEDYELILEAIDAGFQTEADILRFVRRSSDITMGILQYELEMLELGKTIEIVPQGGKTDKARGQVKKLWQRRARQLKPDSSENERDEFEEIGKFKMPVQKLRLVA